MRATPEKVALALKKVLPEAKLARMPRNPAYRDVVLAMLSLGLRRRYPYSEMELNGELQRLLAAWRADVDHVTCRRYMVDLGFLKRDRAGIRYFLNYPKVETTLSTEAMASADELLEQALAESRKAGRGRPGSRRRQT